ncbi:ATP-binding cassette domain-containing protein, partial [Microvirga sp. 3-52]|nr:ATP-binding cassette domain-containing protein [Microvirga sp. 3-52]
SLLSKSISILNQKSHLFNTTVGNNIRIGRPDATDEEVASVVEQAQLAKLIASIPLGLQTSMEEMGHRFSGGERQRIAFARVLLQETPVIIFDEPTIGLDPKTENDLLQTMFTASKDKTVIWVTHHLAGVEEMDEIIFLEEGNIALQGNHEKLLATSTKYRALYEMDKGL